MFVVGRVVTGIGGAGMRSLVSSLIVRKSYDSGLDLRSYGTKVYVRRITLSNVFRSGAITRYCRMAVMAQVNPIAIKR